MKHEPACDLFTVIRLIVESPYIIFLFMRAFLITLCGIWFPSRKSLNGEKILITGAASGIGRLVAIKIAEKTSSVTLILWDINDEGLRNTATECKKYGANVYFHVVDLTSREDIREKAAKVKRQVNNVTVLFNNAGVAFNEYFVDADPIKEETTIKVNLLSYFWTIREFLPQMIDNGRGHILSTASGLALFRFQSLTSYCASKHGVKGFMDTLRLEMKLHPSKPQITVSTVYPGWVKTPMTTGVILKPRYNLDSLRLLDPEFIAEGIVDGIETEKDEIMVPKSVKMAGLFYGILPTKFVDDLEAFIYKEITFPDRSEN